MNRLKVLYIFLCFLLIPSFVFASNLVSTKFLEDTLVALQNNNYENFIQHGDRTFVNAIKEEQFQLVSSQVGYHLSQGYKYEKLGQLKQHGHTVFIYKISYDGREDDSLVKMSLKNDKITGFWIQ